MGMLFQIGDDGRIMGNDWQGVPEWRELDESEMRCVILIWDNQGPYRRMDVEARENRVVKSILGKEGEKFLKSGKYKEAMWVYRACDFDLDVQLLELLSGKIVSLMGLLTSLDMDEGEEVQKSYDRVAKNLATYQKQKTEVEDRINNRGVKVKNMKTVLSGIEKFQERARQMRSEHDVFKNKRAV
jgi:hypothetical protein